MIEAPDIALDYIGEHVMDDDGLVHYIYDARSAWDHHNSVCATAFTITTCDGPEWYGLHPPAGLTDAPVNCFACIERGPPENG